MKKKNRREFLRQMLKGTAVGLLGVLPGTLLNRKLSFAAVQTKDTLESVLKRVTKSNLYKELNVAKLSSEEKLAIAMVKEIPREELNEVITKINKDRGPAASGGICGADCGVGCGDYCGVGCGDYCVSEKAIGVVDQKGELRIKINTIIKSKLLATVKKAMKLNK